MKIVHMGEEGNEEVEQAKVALMVYKCGFWKDEMVNMEMRLLHMDNMGVKLENLNEGQMRAF
jgi:hypothetical protein